jgi:hypothetical protein
MNRPSRPRATAELSDSTHHQLNMYAVAAGAAGVRKQAITLKTPFKGPCGRTIPASFIFRLPLAQRPLGRFCACRFQHWFGPGTRSNVQPQAGELGSHTYKGVLPHSQEKGGREGRMSAGSRR